MDTAKIAATWRWLVRCDELRAKVWARLRDEVMGEIECSRGTLRLVGAKGEIEDDEIWVKVQMHALELAYRRAVEEGDTEVAGAVAQAALAFWLEDGDETGERWAVRAAAAARSVEDGEGARTIGEWNALLAQQHDERECLKRSWMEEVHAGKDVEEVWRRAGGHGSCQAFRRMLEEVATAHGRTLPPGRDSGSVDEGPRARQGGSAKRAE